jgi:shikimate dehydrogenase
MTFYRLALLGDPVDHSRSPEIHGAMLELAGLVGEYVAIAADARALAEAVQGVREGLWHGLNVTMPLKSAAAGLCDGLTEQAASGGSVNTIGLVDGRVRGHSTDGDAFAELAGSDRFEAGAPILLLGGGGSASAALAALAGRREMYVSTRRREQAEVLASRFGVSVAPWATPVAGALVINATPLGMHGEHLPERVLQTAVGLIDLPYGTEATAAAREAASNGLPMADGHEFLVRQAMASFSSWTGVGVAFDDLLAKLRKA